MSVLRNRTFRSHCSLAPEMVIRALIVITGLMTGFYRNGHVVELQFETLFSRTGQSLSELSYG
jgi:hypothetical protein